MANWQLFYLTWVSLIFIVIVKPFVCCALCRGAVVRKASSNYATFLQMLFTYYYYIIFTINCYYLPTRERRSLIKHTYTQHTSYVLCTRSYQHFYIPAHTTCPLEEGECYFLLLPLGERWWWEELQHNSSLLAAAFVVGMQKVAKLPFGEAECKKFIILLSFTNKTVSITI